MTTPTDSDVVSAPASIKLNADAKGRWGFILFDWATQPFYTVVITFLFVPYMVGEMFSTKEVGTFWVNIALVVLAVLTIAQAVLLGPIVDKTGQRKRWVFWFSVLCAASMSLMYFAVPGADTATIWVVMIGYILAFTFMEVAVAFNHSMLPTLVPDNQMGRLSGAAWGAGFAGGLVVLIFVILTISGLLMDPIIKLDTDSGQHNRITTLIAAVWLLVFILPMMIWTPDIPRSNLSLRQATRQGLAELAHTLRHVSHYKNIVRYLIARMFYIDGVNAVIAMGGVYAASALDWGLTQLGVYGIILNIFAILGCLVLGRVDDKRSSKLVINITILGFFIGALAMLSIDQNFIFFVIPVAPPVAENAPLFSTLPEQLFIVFGIILGICMGPVQSASRTLMARIIPEHHESEFFGLYALSGKATAWLAPAIIAVVVMITDDQRTAFLCLTPLLIIGMILLIPVKEVRSTAAR